MKDRSGRFDWEDEEVLFVSDGGDVVAEAILNYGLADASVERLTNAV